MAKSPSCSLNCRYLIIQCNCFSITHISKTTDCRKSSETVLSSSTQLIKMSRLYKINKTGLVTRGLYWEHLLAHKTRDSG